MNLGKPSPSRQEAACAATVSAAPGRPRRHHRLGRVMQNEVFDIAMPVRHHFLMRTTLTLDDDVAELVARHARARGLSLGKTVSDLVRRGLNAPTPSSNENGLTVFRLPADSPTVTTDDVRRIEAEGA
jgi:hypothetical protein